MKTITLGDAIQKAARVNAEPEKGGLWLPAGARTYRTWPLCLHCGREVEAANLEDVSSKGCELRVKCHGKEDSVRITWTCNMTDSSKSPLEDQNVGWCVKRAMADAVFFDPQHFESHARK